MTYQTLEQSLKTKSVVILSSETYIHNEQSRKWLKVRKTNGNKVYRVVQYSNKRFSKPV